MRRTPLFVFLFCFALADMLPFCYAENKSVSLGQIRFSYNAKILEDLKGKKGLEAIRIWQKKVDGKYIMRLFAFSDDDQKRGQYGFSSSFSEVMKTATDLETIYERLKDDRIWISDLSESYNSPISRKKISYAERVIGEEKFTACHEAGLAPNMYTFELVVFLKSIYVIQISYCDFSYKLLPVMRDMFHNRNNTWYWNDGITLDTLFRRIESGERVPEELITLRGYYSEAKESILIQDFLP